MSEPYRWSGLSAFGVDLPEPHQVKRDTPEGRIAEQAAQAYTGVPQHIDGREIEIRKVELTFSDSADGVVHHVVTFDGCRVCEVVGFDCGSHDG